MLQLAVMDTAYVMSIYMFLYRARIGSWIMLGNSVFAIPLAWVVCSYLLGRYSNDQGEWRANAWRDLARSGSIGFTISALLVMHSWVYVIDDASTRFRGFLIPLFLSVAIISSLTRIALFRRAKASGSHSVIICGKAERQAMLTLSEYPRHSHHCSFVGESQALELLRFSERSRNQIVIGENLLQIGEIRKVLLSLRSKGVRILTLTDWCERYLHQVPPELIEIKWLALEEGFALQPGRIGWRAKRLADIAIAVALMITTLPLQLLISILIKAEDGGSVLYSQNRTGLHGQNIVIRKFRSMRLGAEANGPVWSTSNDKRITKIGSFIRKYRIDELPQLANVIVGELSLIGPRPERPEIEVGLRKTLKNYDVRYWVKPGLTGWAQVLYPYGASVEDSRQKLAYDLFYVRNAGVLMDMLIVAKTIKLLLFGKGSIALESTRQRYQNGTDSASLK